MRLNSLNMKLVVNVVRVNLSDGGAIVGQSCGSGSGLSQPRASRESDE